MRQKSWLFLLLATVIAGVSPCAHLLGQATPNQSADTNTQISDSVQRVVNIQRNWGEKMNSPGASVNLKETSREKLNGQTAVVYRILTSGLSKTATYNIAQLPIDYRANILLEGVTLDESGQAICAGRPDTCGSADKPNDPIDLKFIAAKGEPKRLSLISSDGQAKAFVSVVPFPIVGSDRGCSVEAILLFRNAEAVLLHGYGFEPNSTVHHKTISEGEMHEGDEKVDENGVFYTAELPYVQGKVNGTAKVTMQSKKCNPSVSYDWGKDSYQLQ